MDEIVKNQSPIRIATFGIMGIMLPPIYYAIQDSNMIEEIYGCLSIILIFLVCPFFTIFWCSKLVRKLISNNRWRIIISCIPWIAFIGICNIADTILSGSNGKYLLSDAPYYIFILIESLIWSAALNTDGTKKEQYLRRKIALIFCAALLILSPNIYYTSNTWEQSYLSVWNPAFQSCLPFIYPWLLRSIEEHMPRKTRCQEAGLCGIYFSISALLYFLLAGITLQNTMTWRSWSPMVCIFHLVLCIVVYGRERKAAGYFSRYYLWIGGGIYSLCCIAATFLGNKRLREVLYDLGGPAFNISATKRADWLGYHIIAAKSFITGNIGLIKLAGIVLLIICMIAFLYRKKWENPFLECCKGYICLGILLRFCLHSIYLLGMFQSYGIFDSFISAVIIDFTVLCVAGIYSKSHRFL